MNRIFVVEDDENIRELIVYALNSSGFEATGFDDGYSFFKATKRELPDLILLDIMLPNQDGLGILEIIRNTHALKNTPVIMVTAKTSEYDRVKGLDKGADDYISKPFSILELISRVKAVLRRSVTMTENGSHILKYKDIVIDTQKHIVAVNDTSITLTNKEFKLLEYLLENQSIVLTRDKIMSQIWGCNYGVESRTVDMHIKTLRQKLGAAGKDIITIRGIGYKIGG